jgi:tetratricopeptide (TPR) repeat protein
VEDALRRHRNDLAARDVPALVRLWADLGGALPGPDAWREAERLRAFEQGEWTWWARLTVAAAEARRREGRPASADALALDLVRLAPLETLDAPALALAAEALRAVHAEEAEDLDAEIVKRFPASLQAPAARVNLAAAALAEGRVEEALAAVVEVGARWPTHPAVGRADLVRGQALLIRGEARASVALLEEVAQRRQVRGRLQAEVLLALAAAWEAAGGLREAAAVCERLFAVHVAQTDLAATAGEQAVRLRRAAGDTEQAERLLREMAACRELESTGAPGRAREHLRPGGNS